jgi:hypothetical protein
MSGCPRISPLRLRLKRTVSCRGALVGGGTQHLRRPARISLTELIGCSTTVLCAKAANDAMLLATAVTIPGTFRDQRWVMSRDDWTLRDRSSVILESLENKQTALGRGCSQDGWSRRRVGLVGTLRVKKLGSVRCLACRSIADPMIDTTSPHGKLIIAVLGHWRNLSDR